MPKDLKVALLLDYYGALLSEKQQRLVEMYYYDDLSLSEISEIENITRQGASDLIARSVEKMEDFESKLNFISKASELKQILKECNEEALPKNLVEKIKNL